MQELLYLQSISRILHSTRSGLPSSSTPPHAPTRGRQSSTPHADAGLRSTHTSMSSTAVFPSAPVGFLPFLLFSHSTSPPPTLSSACTQSTKAKLSLTMAKPILECYQTPRIVFRTIFHCRTKHLDFIFLIGIHFPLHSFYTRNSIYIEPNAT